MTCRMNALAFRMHTSVIYNKNRVKLVTAREIRTRDRTWWLHG
jgi:hypothetical protein